MHPYDNVIFKKPDKALLDNYMCVDMHFHTTHSDGAASVSLTLKKIRKKNIGVAITDHNEISGVIEAYNKKKSTDLVVPGIEVSSRENIDLLFYFYEINELKRFFCNEIKGNRKKSIYKYKTIIPLQSLVKASKNYSCLVSAAHPFGYGMRKGDSGLFSKYESMLKDIAAVEAVNGGTLRKNNKKALAYISKNNKCITAGSDSHSIYCLGTVLTCSKAKTIKDFLDNIKSKKNFVIGKERLFFKLGEYFFYALNRAENIVLG